MNSLNCLLLFAVICLLDATPQHLGYDNGYQYDKPKQQFSESPSNAYLPQFTQNPVPVGQPINNQASPRQSLPVSPFPATTTQQQSCESFHQQFNNNFNCCGPPEQFCERENEFPEDHELPPNSVNGLIMGKGTYTFVGKDGITKAVDGDLMFKATGKKTHKLGIPSAAVASLAGGGLG